MTNPSGIINLDLQQRLAMPHFGRNPRPFRWKAWVQQQIIALPADPDDPLDPSPLHPACRSGVPCPTSPAFVRGGGIDIGGNDIGFALVTLCRCGIQGMVDRVQQCE